MKYFTLNRIFVAYVIYFVLVVTGLVPRGTVPYAMALLSVWFVFASLEDAAIFFVRAVPLFIAIPITATFDNFNTWRILSLILFVRWFLAYGIAWFASGDFRKLLRSHRQWHREHPVATALATLVLLAAASLIGAPYLKEGIVRMIYFVNLSFVGIVLWDLIRRGALARERVIRAVALTTVIVIIAGFIQLISTYLIDVYQFMNLWGEGIQLRQFGTQWSYIAVWKGNTWLAYYGPQLSLRVFSLFPDSHSFPVFVLMGIPALLAVSLDKIASSEVVNHFKQLIHTRSRMSILWVPLALLIVILSGTRGIWAASIPVVGLAVVLIWWLRRRADTAHSNMFRYLSVYLAIFFMLFAVAYPIFISPQFLLSKGDWALLGQRIRSIVDFGETSNALRLQIWKKTLVSISHHPLLGVGFGNFPVALDQNIQLAKAGSSAHNIYLHIAAEMGIPALLVALWFLWQTFSQTYRNFLKEHGMSMVYYGALLLYLPWVYAYLMTDAALFDERAFLAFAITIALIFAHE